MKYSWGIQSLERDFVVVYHEKATTETILVASEVSLQDTEGNKYISNGLVEERTHERTHKTKHTA